MQRKSFLWIAAILVASGACLLAQEITVTTIDAQNTIVKGNNASIKKGTQGKLVLAFTDEKHQPQELSCDKIVHIALKPLEAEPAAYSDTDIQLILTSGNIINGKLSGKGEAIHIDSKALGTVTIDTQNVYAVKFLKNKQYFPAQNEKTTDKDILVSLSNQSTSRDIGFIESISQDSILFKSDTQGIVKKLAPKDTIALYYAPLGKPVKESEELFAIVVATDGSILRGDIESFDEEKLVLKSLDNKKYSITTSNVSKIYFKNGKVVFLSDLEPGKVYENANDIQDVKPSQGNGLTELKFPYKRDQNVMGGKLSIRGKTFEKGLGVHAKSELTYTLNKHYRKFAATVGVDDCARNERHIGGDALFIIEVDGKKEFEANLSWKDEPRAVEISVEGVSELKLVVDFGEESNICDRADWADARIIR